MVQPLWKPVWQPLKKLNVELPRGPVNLLLDVYTKIIESRALNKCWCTHMHSSINHNRQTMKATQAAISGRPFSLKKEGNSDPHHNWNPEDTMPHETSQSQKDQHCMISLT